MLWERNNPYRLSFSTPVRRQEPAKNKVFNPPVRIIIKDLGIDLPVIPSKIVKNKWETVTSGVSWLSISPVPGEKGNSILYGHNWTNLLGSLPRVKPGYEIQIEYQDKTRKSFFVETTGKVSPNNIGVLAQSEDERITLYTCTGLFDEKRFIAVALPKQ